MSTLLIKNIKSLVQTTTKKVLKGQEMANLATIDNAFLLIDGERIADFGEMSNCPNAADQIIDAAGRMVFPGWCDSHTHIVFAASRESEFVDRINGLSYEEIARRGGGILNSARKLADMSEDDLYASAFQRLKEIQSYGTTAVEIKSGYGLSLEGELKMLRVIKRLKANTSMTIKATFLGAHALPLVYKENRQAYIDLIINEMLPQIHKEGLADYIDAFCEKGFFSVEETKLLIAEGKKYGLKAKIHTNQFNCMGGIQACVEGGAVSVDHLEVLNEEEIACLLDSDTMPTLLPSAPFFINDEHFPPARQMMAAGLPVALATDFNPGSTPSGKMPFVLSLACIKLRMTPEEAINAATINGAKAMEIEADHGSITIGKYADVFITKPMPSIAYLPYAFGSNIVDQVYIKGQRVV